MLKGPFLLTQAALPGMRRRDFGRIINIGSIHSLIASPFKSAYTAAKHGLLGLTRVTALETADTDITANVICPAYVRTPLVEAQIRKLAEAHHISAQEVVDQIMLAPMPKLRIHYSRRNRRDGGVLAQPGRPQYHWASDCHRWRLDRKMKVMIDTATMDALLDRGVSPGEARRIAEWLTRESPAAAWTRMYREFLTPAHDFSLHQWLFERCYGENSLLTSPGPAWLPRESDIARANVTAVAAELGLPDYAALHCWSVEHRANYWELVARRLNVRFRQSYARMLDASDPRRARWMAGAKLNIVESCLAGNADSAAIVESDGSSPPRTRTVGELRSLVARVANSLRAGGICPGDAVAVIGPMSGESIAAHLGVIAAGAAAVSIADSFSAEEIASRLRIAVAKLVITPRFHSLGRQTAAAV